MMMGIGWAEMFLVLLFGGAFGLPLGIPPAKEDPVLAKIAPADCLFYTAWAGVAEPDPKSPNHTEQLLAEAEVRDFLLDLDRRVTAALQKFSAEARGATPQARLMAELLPKWGKAVLTKPTAVFLQDVKIRPDGPPRVQAGLMMNAGTDVGELQALLQKLQDASVETKVVTLTILGGKFQQFQPAPGAPVVTWGVKGQYILAGLGEGSVEAMLERSLKEQPKWLAELRKSLPVERPATVAFVDVKKIVALVVPVGGPHVQAAIDAFGLGNVTSYSSVTGLDQTGFVSKSLVKLDGDPQGLLTVLAAKPLTAADLAGIPVDAPVAVSLRLSGGDLFDAALKSIGQLEPRAVDEIEGGLKRMETGIGVKLREDLLGSLGDVWQVYAAPDAGGLITGWTASVTVKDAKRFTTAHDKLLSAVRKDLGDHPRAPRIGEFKQAGQDLFYLSVPERDMPFTPAWCLAGDRLVVGLYPQAIKAHLARAKGAKSLADAPEVAQFLKGGQGPLMISYLDTKEILRLAYPLLQIGLQFGLAEMRREGIDMDVSLLPSLSALNKHLRPGVTVMRRSTAGIEFETRQTLPGGNIGATAPVLAAVLLPAVGAARESAQRTSAANNLKQIGLALHNFHDVYAKFPAAYNTDKDGKPLLSWRVHILPFVEQAPLYEQFHFDEPWDSEHNKKLIAKIPPVYIAPGSKAEAGKTNYVGIRLKSGILVLPAEGERGKKSAVGIGMASITDGTSNTIMVVESSDAKAVVWTRPDDLTPDEMDPLKALVGLRGAAFYALFCDGSVRLINEKVSVEVLKNLFSRDDGNPVEVP